MQMSPRCDQISVPLRRQTSWHHAAVPTFTDARRAHLLDTQPELVLPALAADLRRVASGLHPADLVAFQLEDREFILGRHEIAGLAMLFEEWDLDSDTRAVAIARARGYLRTAALVPAAP